MALLGAQFVNAVSPSPVGVIEAYAGASAPSGWLLCDGGQTLITAYPELYSVLGTTYGALTNGSGGAGSTHFRVPDLRGRVPMGAGTGSGLTARSLGQAVGTETHTLTTAQMPSHAHTLGPGQSFGVNFGANNSGAATFGLNAGIINTTTYQGPYEAQANGGNGAHPNVQPSLVTNYIIKAVPDAPRSGLAYGSTPPIVTALPTNPQFGDVVTYIADATNGVAWSLQYDATGTYPWKFIGGSALHSEVFTDQTTTSTSFTDLGTVGPSVTAALSGDYEILFGSRSWNSLTNNEARMGISLGGAAVNTAAFHFIANFMAAGGTPAPGGAWHTSKVIRATGFAGGSVTAKYGSNPGGTSWFSARFLTVKPIRVRAT